MFVPPMLDQALPNLRPHLPVLLASFAAFNFVHLVLVPLVGSVFFPSQWTRMSARARNNWAVHICSQLHAVVILPLALRCVFLPELDTDRAFGWHEHTGTVQAVASGYFLWDSLDAIYNFENIGFVLHGVACLLIYLLSFVSLLSWISISNLPLLPPLKPFLAYYASRCLLWETSTFFLNIHWALDKTNRTGGIVQLINGFFLVMSFFSVRLMYGGWVSYQFFQTLYHGRHEIAPVAIAITGIGNVLLQGLNWFWLAKMIVSLRKRFPSAKGDKTQNGTVENGRHKIKSQ